LKIVRSRRGEKPYITEKKKGGLNPFKRWETKGPPLSQTAHLREEKKSVSVCTRHKGGGEGKKPDKKGKTVHNSLKRKKVFGKLRPRTDEGNTPSPNVLQKKGEEPASERRKGSCVPCGRCSVIEEERTKNLLALFVHETGER